MLFLVAIKVGMEWVGWPDLNRLISVGVGAFMKKFNEFQVLLLQI